MKKSEGVWSDHRETGSFPRARGAMKPSEGECKMMSERDWSAWEKEQNKFPPHVKGSETSRAAAKKIEPVTGYMRIRVYECMRLWGSFGRTDLEVQAHLKMKGSTERPRRCELYVSGHIKKKVDSDGKYVTRDGSQVWVAT